jgi:FkbM family methyltransferase
MDKEAIYETLNQAYFSAEPHEKKVIDRLPAILNGASLVVDIGASLGQYTRALAELLRGAEIYSIEPDPVRFEQLRRNASVWARETGNTIKPLQLALTDQPGDGAFYVTHSDVSGGLFPHHTPNPVEWSEITVEQARLDDLFGDRPPHFVKMDVEGAEALVLGGAERILSAGQTTMLIELHDWEGVRAARPDVMRIMHQYGYRSVDFFGKTLFTRSSRLLLKASVADWRGAVRRVRRRIGIRRGLRPWAQRR